MFTSVIYNSYGVKVSIFITSPTTCYNIVHQNAQKLPNVQMYDSVSIHTYRCMYV